LSGSVSTLAYGLLTLSLGDRPSSLRTLGIAEAFEDLRHGSLELRDAFMTSSRPAMSGCA
jgi:hypothetical protein